MGAREPIDGWESASVVTIRVADWKAGGGTSIEVGHEVVMHYSIAASEAELESGDFADSSYGRGDEPISVIIGAGELAPGLDDALLGTREGGTRRVFVTPARKSERTASLVLDIFIVSVEDTPAAEAWRQFGDNAETR